MEDLLINNYKHIRRNCHFLITIVLTLKAIFVRDLKFF